MANDPAVPQRGGMCPCPRTPCAGGHVGCPCMIDPFVNVHKGGRTLINVAGTEGAEVTDGGWLTYLASAGYCLQDTCLK